MKKLSPWDRQSDRGRERLRQEEEKVDMMMMRPLWQCFIHPASPPVQLDSAQLLLGSIRNRLGYRGCILRCMFGLCKDTRAGIRPPQLAWDIMKWTPKKSFASAAAERYMHDYTEGVEDKRTRGRTDDGSVGIGSALYVTYSPADAVSGCMYTLAANLWNEDAMKDEEEEAPVTKESLRMEWSMQDEDENGFSVSPTLIKYWTQWGK